MFQEFCERKKIFSHRSEQKAKICENKAMAAVIPTLGMWTFNQAGKIQHLARGRPTAQSVQVQVQ